MRRELAAAMVAGVLLLTGCGGAAAVLSASDAVPSLTTTLGRIDADLQHHRYAAARASLVQLVAETRSAHRRGDLSTAAAARITRAADRLLALLPRTTAAPSTPMHTAPSAGTPSPSPSRTATATPTPTSAPTSPSSTPTPSPSTNPTPSPSGTPSSTPSPEASPTNLAVQHELDGHRG